LRTARLILWIGCVAASLALMGISALASQRNFVAQDAIESQSNPHSTHQLDPEAELQAGIALTKAGRFNEAIPHFRAAQGHVREEYAADFNLALCYVATRQFANAIEVLAPLKHSGHDTAEVNNLLAQAYIGANQEKLALSAFRQAVRQTPDDEKLYLFLADACTDSHAYDLGLQILGVGLEHLPHSALIHYQRGVFFTFENQPESAEEEFHAAEKFGAKSDVYYMAAGQSALLEGNIQEAVRVTREGIHAGYENFILLSLFGSAVADSAAAPNEPIFTEAETSLKKSLSEHPDNVQGNVALAKLYLRANRLNDAIARLELARKLAPDDPSVYSHLAIAYRREGKTAEAQDMLAILQKLDAAQAAKYKTDSPNKAGYVASGRVPRKPPQKQ
jgi:predicted Zn-dependent protease